MGVFDRLPCGGNSPSFVLTVVGDEHPIKRVRKQNIVSNGLTGSRCQLGTKPYFYSYVPHASMSFSVVVSVASKDNDLSKISRPYSSGTPATASVGITTW